MLFETSLVLKKDKCSSVENTLVLKYDKAIFKKIILILLSMLSIVLFL